MYTLSFHYDEKQEQGDTHGQIMSSAITFPFAKDHQKPIRAHVKSCEMLASYNDGDDTKEIYEIVLQHDDIASWDYEPGDTVGILPKNSKDEVDEILKSLGLTQKADCKLSIHHNCLKPKRSTPSSHHIPAEATPRILLQDCLNIRAIPKKQFLRALATFCTDKEDANLLNSLSTKEASKAYNDLFFEKGFVLRDLLKLCKSCTPSLELLVEHLPRLMPRPYSIANSPLREHHQNTIRIIFSLQASVPGVTTAYLRETAAELVDEGIYLYPRINNSFRFTSDHLEKNQILICVGTGLAPFLGFLEHKEILMQSSKNNITNVGETWLFVGAKSTGTILRRDSLLEWRESGVLNRYYESLSSDADFTYRYVQDQMKANSAELVKFLLLPETNLYVCADGSRISKSIEDSLKICLEEELKVSSDEATQMLTKLRKDSKYIEDLWT